MAIPEWRPPHARSGRMHKFIDNVATEIWRARSHIVLLARVLRAMHYASFRWLVLIIIAAAVAAIGTGALANWHLEGGLELWLVVLVACVLPTGILAGVFNYCWESWVSQLNRSRLESESLAWTDHLTDLPDRLAFVRSADAELVKPGTGSLAVLVIDLDDFRSLNDLVGHHAGEAMLISLGRLINQTMDQACRSVRFLLPGFAANDSQRS